jgi:hypothetical protein
MDQFLKETAHDLSLASQGKATAFDTLNVHIDADRRSAAFAQIPTGGAVDVLAHKAVPKAVGPTPPTAPSFIRTPVTVPKRKHGKTVKPISLIPPMPAAPKPPANWQELSSERIAGPTQADLEQQKREAAKQVVESANKQPLVLEDWSLIRTKDKIVGWVLARNLYMSIPDEVAQYAEGQRISSYFQLGTVQDDEKGTKHDWLWTTSSEPQDFDFDRFRVFYWNRRRHRYETSFRQKDLVGFFPVEVEPASSSDIQPHFSVILQGKDGKLLKKRYSFDGTLVHLVSTERYAAPPGDNPTKAAPLAPEKMEAKHAQSSWFHRQYQKLRQMLKH